MCGCSVRYDEVEPFLLRIDCFGRVAEVIAVWTLSAEEVIQPSNFILTMMQELPGVATKGRYERVQLR
jgi:hypothetical protein